MSREDISSIGWKHVGSGWFIIRDRYKLRKWKGNELDLYIVHGSDNFNSLVFRGEVENKEDLIKLMKQVGINE